MEPRTPVDIVLNQTVLYGELDDSLRLIDDTLEALRVKTAAELGELAHDPAAMHGTRLREAVLS